MPIRGKSVKTAMLTGAVLIAGIALIAVGGCMNRESGAASYAAAGAFSENAHIAPSDGGSIRIAPSRFQTDSGEPPLAGEAARGNEEGAVRLRAGEGFEAELDVPEEGEYFLALDYFLLTEGLLAAEVSVLVNGEPPAADGSSAAPAAGAGRLVLRPLWKSASGTFPKDRYGNEVMPDQKRAEEWQTARLADPTGLDPHPVPVRLKPGTNRIRVTLASGEALIGALAAEPALRLPSYAEYAARYGGRPESRAEVIVIEAEMPDYKNDTTINPLPSRDPGVTPYETNALLLNTLGGKTWKTSGQSVYYEIETKEEGLYQIAFRYQQSDKKNARVFRTLTVDGVIPFAEAKSVPFDYAADWKTAVFGDEAGPYLIYLGKGTHRIGLTADAGPYAGVIRLLRDVILQVNGLNLEIRKLVGNKADQNRDWEITDYLPNLKEDLLGLAETLKAGFREALALNGGRDSSKGLTSVKMAVNILEKLAADPNRVPQRLHELNGGPGSVTQSLSTAIQDFEAQPLTLDRIYIAPGNAAVPEVRVPWRVTAAERVKQFLHTFAPPEKRADPQETVLEVWISRPRNYMELLQRITDERFTPQTGIRVNFSTLPKEQRITLAAASGLTPDVAVGVSINVPFDLGFRGAALNLRQFEDFGEVIRSFSPGALLPMIANGEVYGLPETQDCYVLFYRKDIVEALNLPLPDTWQDVIELMPVLQRYGMNFYTPLAGATGLKPFMATAPFIYQAGGDIYGRDAFETGLDSKESLAGIELMTNLFRLYGLEMQAPSFYEHFRSGRMPLGIGNFATYIQMKIGAPELAGLWGIAPAPGIERNGEVVRWQPGSAQAAMIFKNTRHPEAAWTFLKWWLSAETQAYFANQMQTLYGTEYLWSTANLDAFAQLYWPEEDKRVVLEQWKWLKEVPKTPSSYIIERELSNVWTKVVFEGENIRAATEEAVLEINKETARKMEEFGYMKQGVKVAPYPVPDIEDVERWAVSGDDG